jgi:hypothetical protein
LKELPKSDKNLTHLRILKEDKMLSLKFQREFVNLSIKIISKRFLFMDFISEKQQKRERFSKEEDQKLSQLVDLFGLTNWNFIATLHSTKNANQCRGR